MKTLNLTVCGAKKISPTILVDNKPVKLKKNKFGNFCALVQTEKDKVNIKVQKINELSSRLWFLMGIFFFIVSIFGIFDVKQSKKDVTFDSEFEVNLNKEVTNFELLINSQVVDGKAVEYDCESEVVEIKNLCFENKVVTKRKKILLATKIILWIALGFLLAFLIIKSI
ncbi:MAG: hypothetical protein ACI4TI_00195 [Christensenellales bacterium]